jgi:hypothetical protein
MKEDAGAWTAERACGNQSRPTARPPPRTVSRECVGPHRPNLMHNHPKVAVKNWALRWTDAPESSDECSESLECIAVLANLEKRDARPEDRPADGIN